MKFGIVAIVFTIIGYLAGLNGLQIKELESERKRYSITNNEILMQLENFQRELQEIKNYKVLNENIVEDTGEELFLNTDKSSEDEIVDQMSFGNNATTEIEYNAKRRERTKEEVMIIQQKILDSALSPEVNISSLVSSRNMQDLSIKDQNAVMKELARRFDNGEIDQSQLVPE